MNSKVCVRCVIVWIIFCSNAINMRKSSLVLSLPFGCGFRSRYTQFLAATAAALWLRKVYELLKSKLKSTNAWGAIVKSNVIAFGWWHVTIMPFTSASPAFRCCNWIFVRCQRQQTDGIFFRPNSRIRLANARQISIEPQNYTAPERYFNHQPQYSQSHFKRVNRRQFLDSFSTVSVRVTTTTTTLFDFQFNSAPVFIFTFLFESIRRHIWLSDLFTNCSMLANMRENRRRKKKKERNECEAIRPIKYIVYCVVQVHEPQVHFCQ